MIMRTFRLALLLQLCVFASCGEIKKPTTGQSVVRTIPNELLLHPLNENETEYARFADVLRSENPNDPRFIAQKKVIDRLQNDTEFNSVTQKYGRSKVDISQLPAHSQKYYTTRKAWASWFLSSTETTLFQSNTRGKLAPLQKYDLFAEEWAKKRNQPKPDSATNAESLIHSAGAENWFGRCDAWSLASIDAVEPTQPIKYDFGRGKKFEFTVGDLKSLLIMTYDTVNDSLLEYHGQKMGDPTIQEQIRPDIFPDQFHRFIEVQILQKDRPFLMDYDADYKVWTVPVHGAAFNYKEVPDSPDSVLVNTIVYYANYEIPETLRDTFIGANEASKSYCYILKGTRESNGMLSVKTGYWVVDGMCDSIKNHPDYLFAIPEGIKLQRASRNPLVSTEVVDQLLSGSVQ